ncbi:Omega-amidase YafV [Pseudoalteromonas holothuriae]|uniref:Omega-amidase YafV n=1 Tax=Pseudoalteromonas holothuriae TaxID=2963714 RepID=A0ABM9GE71_9GAMM|nr:amidohydrolase [Pseudoalteromonas sp. CIP111951]CAH9051668.1 Omega-amidase YafV [Pseudoalteromonas sp. CIP111951]
MSEKLKLSMLQLDLVWQDAAANRAAIEQQLETVSGRDLIVLPEMFSTGFDMKPAGIAEGTDGETVAWMKSIAQQHDAVICGSMMMQVDNKYVNRFLWVTPKGEVSHYDKRHLFKFAGEDAQYSAGTERAIFQLGQWRIAPFICFDLRFPVWSRNLDCQYDVALYVANWPKARSLQWKSLVPARAIENQSYVVALNRVGVDGNEVAYSGDSMVVDPLGETLLYAANKEVVLNIELDLPELLEVRRRFPFLQEADGFTLA